MFEMIFLSFVQSLTEFLPISSSGHLVLAENFGFSHQNLSTDIVLHLGTLIAVCCYFYKDILALLRHIWHAGKERKLFLNLCVATLPILCVGYVCVHFVETVLRSPFVIAFTSIFFGLLLWRVDCVKTAEKGIYDLTLKEAFLIGLAQCLAIIPGTSRSGITMTMARFLTLNRVDSARFSMLLSVPTISAGALYVFWKIFQSSQFAHFMTPALLLGFGLSALFGLGAVWFLMRWVKTASFAIFAVYRVLLGLFLLVYFF